ncbi:MAG: hypothetical protein IPO27_01040 [Bacteroidetes bacterium]|nr:hypothetical protein [Bacteroidota bacterium]
MILKLNARNIVILILVGLAIIARLIPHWPNFTPVAAIALFCGCYLKDRRWAIAIPIIVMLISDMILFISKGYSPSVSVYASLMLISTLGFLLKGREQRQTIMVASLVGSLIFFFVTNFGVWLLNDYYSKNLAGLATCYIKAIPFFRYTVMGDLFFNLLLFGSFALIRWRKPALLKAD